MASRGNALLDLDRWIDTAKRIEGLAEAAAPDVAKALEAELHERIAAGEDPYGTPWKLVQSGKRYGKKPLINAAAELFVTAVAGKIYCKLKGQTAHHHHGAVRGGEKRRVLWTEGLSDIAKRKVRAVLDKHFERLAAAK